MGAPAGEVGFPDYIESFHQRLMEDPDSPADPTGATVMDTDLITEMNTLTGSSVYSALAAFDPSTELTTLKTEVDALDTLIDALDPETDWASMMTKALSRLDEAVPESEEVRELRTRREIDLDRAQETADLLNSSAVNSFVLASRTPRS